LYYLLSPWVPSTSAKEYSLLPTMTASDATIGAIIGKEDEYRLNQSGTLRKHNSTGASGSIGLTRTLKLMPTLTASEWKGVTRSRFLGSPAYRTDNLASAFRRSESDLAYLDPDFAEAFMGFPTGWTVLKHSETP
jgi:hypothetical protein